MPKSKSKRQTRQPPPKTKPKSSPEWVSIGFFLLLLTGVAIIIGNYIGIYGTTANWRLFYGLGLVFAAFVISTQWH